MVRPADGTMSVRRAQFHSLNMIMIGNGTISLQHWRWCLRGLCLCAYGYGVRIHHLCERSKPRNCKILANQRLAMQCMVIANNSSNSNVIKILWPFFSRSGETTVFSNKKNKQQQREWPYNPVFCPNEDRLIHSAARTDSREQVINECMRRNGENAESRIVFVIGPSAKRSQNKNLCRALAVWSRTTWLFMCVIVGAARAQSLMGEKKEERKRQAKTAGARKHKNRR